MLLDQMTAVVGDVVAAAVVAGVVVFAVVAVCFVSHILRSDDC